MINHNKNREFAKRNLVVSPSDHWKFEYFVDDYLQTLAKDIADEFDFVWNNQKEVKESYCDIDWSVTKIEVEGRRVLYVDDHVTSSIYDKFIFIKETIRSYDYLHIRRVWNDSESDYVEGGTYTYRVQRPNLQWYIDRNLTLKFDDKLRKTAFGGTYGDCRDTGFVLTLKKLTPFDEFDYTEWEVEKGTLYHWGEFTVANRNLFGCRYDLVERNLEMD